jgi:hypothetical protein
MRAALWCLLLSSCCINPTPMPAPTPVVPSEAAIRPGPSQFPDAGFVALTFDPNSDWAPLDARTMLERGPQGGGYHLTLRYDVAGYLPQDLFVISRVVRERDGLVVGRDDTGFDAWEPLDGGLRRTAGATTVRLCPTRRDAGIVGEALRLESYGFQGPLGPRLVEATKSFRVECVGCEFDCGG